MAINKILYPIDLTGESVENRIDSEPHVIGTDRYRAFALNYGPFFADKTVIIDVAKHRRLVRGVDFEFVYAIPELIKATGGEEVVGVVVITNKNVSTNIQVTYNIIGGHYASNVYVINKAIQDLALDNRNAYWRNILDKPELFQPAPHDHDFGDTYGLEYIITVLSRMGDNIVVGNSQVTDKLQANLNKAIKDLTAYTDAHKADKNNPHNVTAHQINTFDKDEVNNFLAGIARRFEALEPRLAAIIRDIASNLGKINTTNANLGIQGNRIGDVEHTQSTINMLLSSVNDRCDAINTNINAINSEITLLKKRDGELAENINDNVEAIAAANRRIDGVNTDILALRQKDGEHDVAILALGRRIDNVTNIHNTAMAAQNIINNNLTEQIQNSINVTNNHVKNLERKIEEVRALIGSGTPDLKFCTSNDRGGRKGQLEQIWCSAWRNGKLVRNYPVSIHNRINSPIWP